MQYKNKKTKQRRKVSSSRNAEFGKKENEGKKNECKSGILDSPKQAVKRETAPRERHKKTEEKEMTHFPFSNIHRILIEFCLIIRSKKAST